MRRIKYIRRLFYTAIIIVLFLCAGTIYAAGQSSVNYTIESDVISGGGGESSSINYFIEHTTGQSSAIGDSSSTNYTNYAGFWYTVSCDSPTIDDLIVDGCLSELCVSDLIANASDPCGGNLTYTWTPLNGGNILGSGASVEFDPPDTGPHPCPYQVELMVASDVSGLESAQVIDIYIKMAGDADGNGVVNLMDKLLVRQHYGELEGDPGWDARADVTCDGVVNLMDKLKVRQQYGQTDGCVCE